MPLTTEEKRLRMNAYTRKWRLKHKKQFRAIQKAYREKNKDKLRDIKRQQRQEDKEGYLRRTKDWKYNKIQKALLGENFIHTRGCSTCNARYLPRLGCILCSRDKAYENMSKLGLSDTLHVVYGHFPEEREGSLIEA